MLDSTSQFSRYKALVSHLAHTTLTTASGMDAAEASLTAALPAARVLAGGAIVTPPHGALPASLSTLARGSRRLATLTGQSRPVYWPLAAHLVLRALSMQHDAFDASAWRQVQDDTAALADASEPMELRRETVAMVLWQSLCRIEATALIEDQTRHDEAVQRVEQVIAAMPDDGALHGRSADDQLDHWTYRELSGLHALVNLAWRTQRETWWHAAERVAEFHLAHTQPDYTTYEPWAVHAFLRWPTMTIFADQQLHDMQTNLHISGPSASLLPALLLADASAALTDPAFGALA